MGGVVRRVQKPHLQSGHAKKNEGRFGFRLSPGLITVKGLGTMVMTCGSRQATGAIWIWVNRVFLAAPSCEKWVARDRQQSVGVARWRRGSGPRGAGQIRLKSIINTQILKLLLELNQRIFKLFRQKS